MSTGNHGRCITFFSFPLHTVTIIYHYYYWEPVNVLLLDNLTIGLFLLGGFALLLCRYSFSAHIGLGTVWYVRSREPRGLPPESTN